MALILVADSDAYACEMVAVCLERSGHQVVCAEHGEAAMAAILQKSPQLVMTEIMLPMRSGFEILAALKGLGLGVSVPVMIVSASATQRDMDRAFAEGVSDYVVKPFHLRELALRANLALARREAALAAVGRPAGWPGQAGAAASRMAMIAA